MKSELEVAVLVAHHELSDLPYFQFFVWSAFPLLHEHHSAHTLLASVITNEHSGRPNMTHLQDIFFHAVATDLQSMRLFPNREEVIAQICLVSFSVIFFFSFVEFGL